MYFKKKKKQRLLYTNLSNKYDENERNLPLYLLLAIVLIFMVSLIESMEGNFVHDKKNESRKKWPPKRKAKGKMSDRKNVRLKKG